MCSMWYNRKIGNFVESVVWNMFIIQRRTMYSLHSRSLMAGSTSNVSSRLLPASVYDLSPDLLKFIFDEPRLDVCKSSAL